MLQADLLDLAHLVRVQRDLNAVNSFFKSADHHHSAASEAVSISNTLWLWPHSIGKHTSVMRSDFSLFTAHEMLAFSQLMKLQPFHSSQDSSLFTVDEITAFSQLTRF